MLLLVLVPFIIRAVWKHWRVYRAFSTVPYDPEMHFIFGHAPKLVRDMGAALDWIKGLASTHGWKSLKVSYGPTLNMFVCVHPDTASVVLRSGGIAFEQVDCFINYLLVSFPVKFCFFPKIPSLTSSTIPSYRGLVSSSFIGQTTGH